MTFPADLGGVVLCLFDPASPESVATAWVVRHACQRDQLSLQLQEQPAKGPLKPDFIDRLTLVAGIEWTPAQINLLAHHATDVVLFPALAGFESYDGLRTAAPYRNWKRDGYTVKEIGPAYAQRIGKAAVTREAHHVPPAASAWMYFCPGVPVPSFLTLSVMSDDLDLTFRTYDAALRDLRSTSPSGSEVTLLR